MSAAIADWKYEKISIQLLRLGAETLLEAEAQVNPGVQVCKAYRFVSTFNGSGGGSICTIYIRPMLLTPELLDVV